MKLEGKSRFLMLIPRNSKHFIAIDEEYKVRGLEINNNVIKSIVSTNSLVNGFHLFDKGIITKDLSSIFGVMKDVVVTCLTFKKKFNVMIIPLLNKSMSRASPSKSPKDENYGANDSFSIKFHKVFL